MSRSALKWSRNPREPFVFGFPNTPKKTSPSGATIGEAGGSRSYKSREEPQFKQDAS